MVVVSSREFRANQRKYFDLARTNDVVIMSRSFGSYRLVPIKEEDLLIDSATLDAKAEAEMFTTLLAIRQTVRASCVSSISHWKVEFRNLYLPCS